MRRLLSSRTRAVASLATVTLGLVACAKPEPKIAFDRSSLPQIRTVGVVTPRVPDAGRMDYTDTPTVAPSALGIALVNLIDLKMRSDRNDTLEHALTSQGYDLQAEFTTELTDALREAGYDVIPVSAKRETDDFLGTYPIGDSQQPNALLDVVVKRYGFKILGSGYNGRCSPYFFAKVRLINPQTSAVLMRDYVGYSPPREEADKAKAAIQSQRPTLNHCFDELDAKPEAAIAMLRTLSTTSAKSVADRLR